MVEVKNINFFEERALEFYYSYHYIPEIDDGLSGNEYYKKKLFWAIPFDFIILPIGFYFLNKRKQGVKNAKNTRKQG